MKEVTDINKYNHEITRQRSQTKNYLKWTVIFWLLNLIFLPLIVYFSDPRYRQQPFWESIRLKDLPEMSIILAIPAFILALILTAIHIKNKKINIAIKIFLIVAFYFLMLSGILQFKICGNC